MDVTWMEIPRQAPSCVPVSSSLHWSSPFERAARLGCSSVAFSQANAHLTASVDRYLNGPITGLSESSGFYRFQVPESGWPQPFPELRFSGLFFTARPFSTGAKLVMPKLVRSLVS